jgi:hypothetical protein
MSDDVQSVIGTENETITEYTEPYKYELLATEVWVKNFESVFSEKDEDEDDSDVVVSPIIPDIRLGIDRRLVPEDDSLETATESDHK